MSIKISITATKEKKKEHKAKHFTFYNTVLPYCVLWILNEWQKWRMFTFTTPLIILNNSLSIAHFTFSTIETKIIELWTFRHHRVVFITITTHNWHNEYILYIKEENLTNIFQVTDEWMNIRIYVYKIRRDKKLFIGNTWNKSKPTVPKYPRIFVWRIFFYVKKMFLIQILQRHTLFAE